MITRPSFLSKLLLPGLFVLSLSACGVRASLTPAMHATPTAYNEAATEPVAGIEWESGVILLRGDRQRTGIYHISALREQPDVHWQAQVGHSLVVTPLVADDFLYAISVTGTMYALNVETGKVVWSVSGLGQHENAGAIAGEMLISAGVSRQVRARDRRTGEEFWAFETKYPVQGSPLIVEDRVFVATDREVYALDLESGELIWSTATGEDEAYMGPPAYQEGMIYTTGGRLLLALDSQTGEVLWRVEKEEMFLGLAVANNIVYVGNWDRTLYAFDRSSGKELWAFHGDGEIWSFPAVTAETVYAGNNDRLYALDAQSGELRWSFQAGGKPVSEPLLSDGVIYITDGNHEVRRRPLHLHALDALTGEPLWAFEIENTFLPAPALGEGVIYISSRGQVIALKK